MKKATQTSSDKFSSSKKQMDGDSDIDYDNDSYQERHHDKLNAKKNQQNRDKARKLKRG